MYKKLIPYMFIFLVCLTAVLADNTVTFNFADEEGNAVQNVHVYVFECTNFRCSELTGTSVSDALEWGSSGSNSFYEVDIPGVTSRTWYVAYIFGQAYDDEYLPKYQKFHFTGDNYDLGEEDIVLEKATDCQSEIQTFTLSDVELNEPITFTAEVDSALSLTQGVSAFSSNVYPWGYDSSEAGGRYDAWYSSETDVELNIKKAWSISDDKEDPFDSSSPFESGSGPFSGSSETYVTIDTQTETVDIPAGETETVTFTWTPEEENDYRVVLTTTVTDAQCGSTDDDTETEDFTVEEDEEEVIDWPDDYWDFDPNIISCSADPMSAEVGEEIQFDVTTLTSWLIDESYAWDFGDGNSADEAEPTYSYDTAGTYTAIVTVTDEDGEYDTCSVDVEIVEITELENVAPTLDCSALPTEGTVDEELTLVVTATDSDGTITDYDWDFGDGNVDSTTDDETTHTYTSAETYTLYVEVTDEDGDTASCSADIEISEEDDSTDNEAPTASCGGPYEGVIGETITFDGSESEDSDGYLVAAAWNFGDGSFYNFLSSDELTDEELQTEHSYDEAGEYTVTLFVTDDDGDYGICETTATITEEVDTDDDDGDDDSEDTEVVAVISAEPTSGEPRLWVQFSSEDSSGDGLSYYWTFGDGEHSTRPNPGHYYDKEGTYTATLTVTDADGNSDTDSVTITVGDELENIASRHYYVDGIAMSNDGIVEAGNTLELYMTTENIADMDKDTVAFNAIIQELGIYETTVEMNMNAGEKEAVVLYIDIPAYTEPGSYYVRITISDDYVKRVIYRDIIVTD